MLDSLLNPKSIAIVGVSLEPMKVGHQIFSNLLSFPGKVFPINPKHTKIAGHTCYPDILSVPDHIDLVVIATPFFTVEDVVHQCIDKKVKAVICITAGFAENGKKGKELQERIAKKLADNHIALLGPNTLGAVNPHEHMNASFAPAQIDKGSIALISQSGALLTTIFSQFSNRGVGCSFAVSLGNGAGVSVNDALRFAADDPHTTVIGVYLESIPNITEFFTLTKEISKTKPVLLLKGGTTDAGQHASLSHTAALATDSTLLSAGQYQYGFCMVDTIEQWFETLFFLDKHGTDHFPSNLMILTNAGGPGVNSVDLASKSGLNLAKWHHHTIETFAREIPRVHPSNPTDLLGDAGVRDIQVALELAQEDPLIESVLLIITPQAVTDIPGIVRLLIERSHKKTKPFIVAPMIGEEYRREINKLRDCGITTVEYANEGVEIFTYVDRVRRAFLIDRSEKLMRNIHQFQAEETKAVEPSRKRFALQTNKLEEVYLLLEDYGFTLPHCAIVTHSSQLDDLDKLDPSRVYPLIAKTANLNLKHKAVLGAVVKDIQNKEDAVNAYEQLKRFGEKALFQEVIEDAQEVIVGGRKDPVYGTFIAVGTGGSLTNIIADRQYIFLPASQREIRDTLKRTKLITLLTPEQQALVLNCLEQFATVLLEHPEIGELEINPLMVTAHTAYVADVKVELFK